MPRYIVRAPDEVDVASGSGTTNRLMRFDSSDDAADGSLLDDGSGALKQPGAATDVAPTVTSLIGAHAYAQATSNTTGAALRLAPGIGRRFITIDDYAQAGTGTVTVTVNGTATVLTAGTDFTAATSNAVTATNLATAIEAIAGVSATAVSAVVYVTPDDSTYTLTLARSVAAFATVTSGTDGTVSVALGNLSLPSANQLLWSTDTGLKRAAAGVVQVTDGSTGAGSLYLADGSAAAPSLAFADTNTGVRGAGGGQARLVADGVDVVYWNNPNFAIMTDAGGLYFGASSNAAIKHGGAAGALSLTDDANGKSLNVKLLTELTTIAAAATTDTTIEAPAGSLILAVSVRVTTVIPTAATFTVTGAGSGTTFNTTAVSAAADTTNVGTAAGVYYNSAAQKIRITPNLTPGDTTGRVRVTIHYIDITPPTS